MATLSLLNRFENRGASRVGAKPDAAFLPAYVLGVLDGSIGFAYMANIDVNIWHTAVLASKLALLVLNAKHARSPSLAAYLIIAGVIVVILASMVVGFGNLLPIAGAAAFAVELAVTACLLNRDRITQYAAGVACTILASATVHIYMALTGRIITVWGRYLYFNRFHPNLGGEIAAVGAIAAALGLPRISALIAISVLAIDSMFLQSRSAVLVEFACIAICLSFDKNRKLSKVWALVLTLSGALGALILLVTSADSAIMRALNLVFMFDSETRGTVTGFSGRTYLWDIALQLFQESPIFGHGLGYFESIGYAGPHNMVLYGLAEDGLCAIPLLGAIIYSFYMISRGSLFVFFLLASSIFLISFNDRFINLNPYPFILYVLLAIAADAAPSSLFVTTNGSPKVRDPSVPLRANGGRA